MDEKGDKMDNNYNIALLIDVENVSSKYMKALDKELIVLGKVTYKRMYGDFTSGNTSGWKELVNEFSITPVQQFSYTTSKNSTDSKMVIDAMDILYSGNVDAFCIMSSDSDFTTLAKRLKEANMFIIGAGEGKTPSSFVKTCDRFFYLDQLAEEEKIIVHLNKNVKKNKPANKTNQAVEIIEEPTKEVIINPLDAKKAEIEDFVVKILEEQSGKPYPIAKLLQKIYQAYPEFNVKKFGARKIQDFFSKDKFIINRGKTTDLVISLKVQ